MPCVDLSTIRNDKVTSAVLQLLFSPYSYYRIIIISLAKQQISMNPVRVLISIIRLFIRCGFSGPAIWPIVWRLPFEILPFDSK